MRIAIFLLAAAALLFAGENKLGKPLALKQQTAIAKLADTPEGYVGKTVQVKGTVRAVCQEMGCWMEIADPASNKAVKIKVEDGEIVFPKDAAGKSAIAEGTFTNIGAKDKPVYQIKGTGAVILD